MTADIIKFPKVKAARPVAASDFMIAHACAVASGEALMALADETRAARERGDLSPAMQQIAAIASLFGDK